MRRERDCDKKWRAALPFAREETISLCEVSRGEIKTKVNRRRRLLNGRNMSERDARIQDHAFHKKTSLFKVWHEISLDGERRLRIYWKFDSN